MSSEKVKFLLNWNHFGEHLSSCMTKLMTDSSYSDIIIATADKHMIYSHRFVLGNSSKYFQRLLKHVNRERGFKLVVALPEIKYETFKILMNYMYKGETQVPHELLPSVIKAGQFLEINGLVNLNENDCNGSCENSLKHLYGKGVTTPSSSSESEGKHYKKAPYTLHTKENTQCSGKNVVTIDKRKRTIPNDDIAAIPSNEEKSGKENHSKMSKSVKCKNATLERQNIIQLPLKRKSSGRDGNKKFSATPSGSNYSVPPIKISRCSISQDNSQLQIKEEKYNIQSTSYDNDNDEELEMQDLAEKITIKVEAPDDIEEVVYNELKCDYCHDSYTKPSDWVKHMADEHGDKGYHIYKNLEKNVGSSSMMTCVVCSYVCLSAAEWVKHLRMWHTEKELADANRAEAKKSNQRIKRKSRY